MSEGGRDGASAGLGAVVVCLAGFWCVSCVWCGSCAVALNYGQALPGESRGAGVVATMAGSGALLAAAAVLLARAAAAPRLKSRLTGAARSRWEWLCAVCAVSVGVFVLVALAVWYGRP